MVAAEKTTDLTADIQNALALLVEPGQVVELRVLGVGGNKNRPETGYFDDMPALAAAAVRHEGRASGIYVTINPVRPALLNRAVNRMGGFGTDATNDRQIVRRRFLPIDCDPERPSGISSTDAEHEAALTRTCQVRDWLTTEHGWPEPIRADSGNGGHLLYRIDLPDDDDGLTRRVLAVIAKRFTDDDVKIDTSVHNPARIWKLYGTTARKGDSTKDCPHRLSRIIDVPDNVEVVSQELLERLAGTADDGQRKTIDIRTRPSTDKFDVPAYLTKHGVRFANPEEYNGGQKWKLDACVWNGHTDHAAVVWQEPNGKICANCSHDSCEGRGWPELREHFEPGYRAEKEAKEREFQTRHKEPRKLRPDADDASGETDSSERPAGRAKESERLLELTESGELFHTPEGVPYVRYERSGHRETRPLGRSSAFREWLATEAHRDFGKIPGDKAINEVLMLCRARAMEAEPARPVVTRIGAADGKVYIDLADRDWRAIEIDGDGWRIVADPPVCFRRPNGMLPLPDPVTGGSLDELRILVNVGSDQDWTLMVGWLLMAIHPDGPYPHLAIHGEQGSAKSTTTRLLKSLIDPSQAPTRAQPKNEQDIAIGARNCRILALDNLSAMPGWFSDSLCRLSTGAGLATRLLYTDDEESTFYGKNPAIFNGIAEIAARGDLISRTVLITLPTIEGTGKRMGEREVGDLFADAHPRILGVLCDAASEAIHNLPTTHLADPPRMADFAAWVTAAEPALGWEPGTFATAYAENRANAVSIELDASPLASTLMAFIEKEDWWQGTATDLLKELTLKADIATTHLRDWPKQPNVLSAELRRLAPALRHEGFGVVLPEHRREGTSHARLLVLHKIRV